MLYQMLAGRLPFESDAPGELMVMHLRDEPPPIREHNELVPREIADFCLSLLKKDPAQRPAMADVARRLSTMAENQRTGRSHEALTPLPLHAVGSGPTPLPTPTPTPAGASSTPSAARSTPGATPFPNGTIAAVMQNSSSADQTRELSAERSATEFLAAEQPVPSLAGSTGMQGIGQLSNRPPRSRLQYALLPLGIVLLGAGALVYRSVAQKDLPATVASVDPPPTPTATATPTPQPVVAPPAKKSATPCRLETDPPGAAVVRISDGQSLGTTPIDVDVSAPASALKLRVQLFGYAAEELALSPEDGAVRRVPLTPQRNGSQPASKTKKKTKGGRSIFDRLD